MIFFDHSSIDFKEPQWILWLCSKKTWFKTSNCKMIIIFHFNAFKTYSWYQIELSLYHIYGMTRRTNLS